MNPTLICKLLRMFLGRVQKVEALVILATCQMYKELNLLKYSYYMMQLKKILMKSSTRLVRKKDFTSEAEAKIHDIPVRIYRRLLIILPNI